MIKFTSHFYNGLSSDDQVDQSRGGGGGPTPVPSFPHPQIPIFCMFNGDLWGKILKFGTKISHQNVCFKSLYCYCKQLYETYDEFKAHMSSVL